MPGDEPPFTIREVTVGDEAAVCHLFAEVDDVHAEALPHVFRKTRSKAAATFRRGRLVRVGDEGSVVFVAEHAGTLLGLVRVGVRQSPDLPIMTPRRYAFVHELVVAPGYRRRGVGRALMEHAHRWARERGLEQVEVVVYDVNRAAVALYERLGYTGLSHRLWRRLD